MLLAAQLFSKVSHFFCFRVRLEVGEKIHLEKLGEERIGVRQQSCMRGSSLTQEKTGRLD